MALKVAVIGLGRFGRILVEELAKTGAEVVAIDSVMENVEAVKNLVPYAVRMDATDEQALKAHNLDQMDAVVVAIGQDFEALVMTCQELLLLGVTKIYARAVSRTHRRILERMGILDVIMPEEESGKRLAQRLVNPGLVDYFDLSGEYRIVEIEAPTKFVQKTLMELDLRRRYNVNLVTLRRSSESGKSELMGVPAPDSMIEFGDMLVLLGTSKDIQHLIEQNQ